jgi:hypothetical protein
MNRSTCSATRENSGSFDPIHRQLTAAGTAGSGPDRAGASDM